MSDALNEKDRAFVTEQKFRLALMSSSAVGGSELATAIVVIDRLAALCERREMALRAIAEGPRATALAALRWEP